MSRPRAMIVFGARPNLMKVAPLWRAMTADGRIEGVLVDTGQHYDPAMSDDFLKTLELPDPDVQLGVGPAFEPLAAHDQSLGTPGGALGPLGAEV